VPCHEDPAIAHQGFLSIPATGKDVRIRWGELCQVKDGRIGACNGLTEFESLHQKYWLHAFPDRAVQDLDCLFAEGAYTGAAGWNGVLATHTGRYLDCPAKGKRIGVNGLDFWRREDDMFTYRGKPVARTTTKAWYAALKRVGIEDFRWHDLRHTWASWHAQNSTSTQELQELGGWSCTEMVQRYAHLGGDHLKKAASQNQWHKSGTKCQI
jgi:hypothetical protein